MGIFRIVATLVVLGAATGCGNDPGDTAPYVPPWNDEYPVPITADEPEFRRIEAGVFIMGEPDPLFEPWATPAHQVEITRPFYIGTTEVTNQQWFDVFGELPALYEIVGRLEEQLACMDCPVNGLNWSHGVAYANARSALEGLEPCYDTGNCFQFDDGFHDCVRPNPMRIDCDGYRLPTEAEWEYAARAGSEAKHYCPDYNRSDPAACWDRIAHHTGGIQSVGQLQPNAWGLYDVIGNTCEVVQDVDYDYTEDDQVDPLFEEGSVRQLARGGAVDRGEVGGLMSLTIRDGIPDSMSLLNQGFRIARTIIEDQ